MAIKSDDSLWAWGASHFEGSIINYQNAYASAGVTPIQLGTESWNVVAGDDHHFMVIKNDGSLWAWGSNRASQLGDGGSFKQTPQFLLPSRTLHHRAAVAFGMLPACLS